MQLTANGTAHANGNGRNGLGPDIAPAGAVAQPEPPVLAPFDLPPDPAALAALPRAVAERYRVVPIEMRSDLLLVAMVDPGDVHVCDELSRIGGCRVRPVAASPEEIHRAISRLYAPVEAMGEHGAAASRRVPESLLVLGQGSAADAPAIAQLNRVLSDAVDQRASDIHVDPQERQTYVRFRIDGILSDWLTLDPSQHPPLVSRVKVLANMDIAKFHLPQDGRFTVQLRGHRWDVRVSTVPGVFGETAVLRLLPKDTTGLALEDLGMQEGELRAFRSLVAKPYGMVLVTGPTGAGKTTTLYTALGQIDCVSRKVMTLEDPVEYELPRVTQMQVHPKIGLTFAAGLRHVLRQDPDVLMVGEIRDRETLEMAVQAALTGHLVFSTLHCNDAAAAAARCLEMGLEPYLFTSSVIGVVAQRLVRRVCAACREEQPMPASLRERLGIPGEKGKAYRGRGCPACRQTGYRGRLAIFELFPLTEPLKEAVQNRVPAGELRRIAAAGGLGSLRQDALRKVELGLTTPEEVFRAVYLEE